MTLISWLDREAPSRLDPAAAYVAGQLAERQRREIERARTDWQDAWADVRGKPVCVSQGSNYTKPLATEYGAQVKAFRGQPESLLALRGNNCVAAVHVAPTLRMLVAHNPDWKDYATPLPTDLIPSPSVIWVRKGETDTQNALDRIVQDWHRSGWLLDVERKNGMTPSQAVLDLRAKLKAQRT